MLKEINYQHELYLFLEKYGTMRKAQNAYFEQKKLDGTRFPTKAAREMLKESKRLEKSLDENYQDLWGRVD